MIVVDDSPMQCRLVSRLLTQRSVAHVCAADGAEAVAMVTRSPPGRFWCVLMDREMPTMGGVDATRAIHAARPALLIVGLTADANDPLCVAEFRGAGAHGVLAKPFNAEGLELLQSMYASANAP